MPVGLHNDVVVYGQAVRASVRRKERELLSHPRAVRVRRDQASPGEMEALGRTGHYAPDLLATGEHPAVRAELAVLGEEGDHRLDLVDGDGRATRSPPAGWNVRLWRGTPPGMPENGPGRRA